MKDTTKLVILLTAGLWFPRTEAAEQFRFTPIPVASGERYVIALPPSHSGWRLGLGDAAATGRGPSVYLAGQERDCKTCPASRRLLPRYSSLTGTRSTSEGLDLTAVDGNAKEIVLLCYLAIGTTVEVTQGGTIVMSARVSSEGAIYQDAFPTPARFNSPPDFFANLQRSRGLADRGRRMGNAGELLCGPAELRDHLISMNLPTLATGSETVSAGIAIHLDETGGVRAAEMVGTPTDFAMRARDAVLSWRFRPFFHEGRPAKAKAVIVVVLRPSGRIEVPGLL